MTHQGIYEAVCFCLAATFATPGCSTARDDAVKSGARVLSASQLRATLPGIILRDRSGVYGSNVYLYLFGDGTAVVSTDLGAISGPYRITDDGLLCISGLPPGPGETCCTLYQEGDQYKLFYQSGDIALVATRVLGEDEHFFR